jgi:steroid 5-alpha reductase family enzyme
VILLWSSVLPLLLLLAVIAWGYAARRRNVNIVDSLWSLFFLIASAFYLGAGGRWTPTSLLLFSLVALWAIRLSVHLALRNAGKAEDRRYAAMRAANPRFNRRSLVTVFGLQAVLAWLISLPLAAALTEPAAAHPLHWVGAVLFLVGFTFEAVADWQLVRFKARPENRGRVLDSGLWRYSRHPNYFGEAVIWWAFYLFALASGAAWTVFAPVLMTFLLLKVSGVSLLEKDIHERRPGYRRYSETTPAFFPWRPHRATTAVNLEEERP